ncbi:probable disease resistance protein At4g33300 [Cryptomeria japonica]|uniref:probable disease resistance protein At4g33300 n=1 Tax=Cryptomeria japonica TaxID=3369 RepID=UPI0027DA0DFB|nr:probable disease resistance protein At4g33300 [Cryptomeria japonica]
MKSADIQRSRRSKGSGVVALPTQTTQTSDKDVVRAIALHNRTVVNASEWTDDTSVGQTASPLLRTQLFLWTSGCFANIVFITVSQSPNLKGILKILWEKIFGKNVAEFQNVEDARMELQQRFLRQSKPTLVVLDDVWSRADLEILLFEAPGYKTLITTRDTSTIPRNASTRLYQWPLLNKEDSLSLFCLSAFGQTSIPSTADANLVTEVQAECKGLPLALKVVGSSLYGEPHVAWENAKKRQSISIYHEEGLFRCLKTSIDCLDDVGRECFLDTASFPEDKKICADALLNIWVYVRKMEWQDAYIMLQELARRNLLSLISNQGIQSTISYGCASELFFSQHDVMRDLALYLGCQDSIVHRKRLLMPRKEHCLPGEWELLRDGQFSAKIVSIHTGSMAESDWYEMNLPETESLAYSLVLHLLYGPMLRDGLLPTAIWLKNCHIISEI